MPTVKEITTYPIKSCGGISWDKRKITPRGILNDREFMIVDAGGRFVTQREYPKMCLVAVSQKGLELTLQHPDANDPASFLVGRQDGDEMIVTVWDDTVQAYDQGDELADWLSIFLDIPDCRLVRIPPYEIRNTRRGEGMVGFADGYPVLGISQASLDDLNARMLEPLPMNRFRPNIVFDGCVPFQEDTWRRIRIGEVEFVGETLCARCEIPTTNQETAERGKEPNTTLAQFRRKTHIQAPDWKLPYPKRVYFGRNFNIAAIGKNPVIEVGMEVEVLERD